MLAIRPAIRHDKMLAVRHDKTHFLVARNSIITFIEQHVRHIIPWFNLGAFLAT